MKLKRIMLTSVLAAFLFTGCNEDDDEKLREKALDVSSEQTSFNEADGTISIKFSTGAAYDSDITIAYEVTGTAVSGDDFQALEGAITLPSGQTSVSQDLILIDDTEVESSEDIVVTILSVAGVQDLIVGLQDEVILTITDNDSYPFENGILVSHEGNFLQGNASVSFVSTDLSTVENSIFKSANNIDVLGDNVQSMAFHEDKGYVVVNGSQKVEVVNRYTFESVTTIGGPAESDFLNPRYMAIANGKGYVTNWGDGTNPDDDYVAVIDLEDNTVIAKIPVVEGPERILAKDNIIYVAQQGGYNQNNVISVIDATTNTVTTTVSVGDRPNSLQVDGNGDLWVLSGGNPSWTGNETAGQLDKISTVDNAVLETLSFAQTAHPSSLGVDGSNLYYYLTASVYKMEAAATTLPTMAEIMGLSFYDMAIIQGKLYGVDAKDYSSNGSLEVYDLNDNALLGSKEVSIIPGEIYYNGTAER